MIGLLNFTTLVITTMFAAGAAVLVNWLLLRATFQLMRPATAGKATNNGAAKGATRLTLVPGTVQVMRAYAVRR
jgi:hypothetical protein